MTFCFLVGSWNLIRFFWVSWRYFVCRIMYDCIHWVAKSCTTKAYRWLLRDFLASLKILWSAVIKYQKFPLGRDCTNTFSARSPCFFVFKQKSQFGSFGKCVKTLCLPETGSTFARRSTGASWQELEVLWSPSGYLQGSIGNSCDISCYTSSPSPLTFLNLVSLDSCSVSPRSSSLTLPLLSGTVFSVYLLMSIKRSWWWKWWRNKWRYCWGKLADKSKSTINT